MVSVNYLRIRERLEFLYFTLNYSVASLINQHGLSSQEASTISSHFTTIALNLIYVQRDDNRAIVTIEESIKVQGICQAIADEFIHISQTIQNECGGIPREAVNDRYKVILDNGMDKIMAMIKKHIESQEVSNG